MTTISKIKKTINLEPKHLTFEIEKFILIEIKRKYEKTCCEEYGLIISIHEILSYDNIINKDSIIVTFTVFFNATIIKPVKGMQLSFIPSLILSKGIFGKLYDFINFFIPENKLTENGYIFSKDCFKKKNNDEIEIILNKEKNVMVTIEDIKFDMIKYNCISILKEDE